ncbi:MAG TPA: hypothetical protein VF518_07810, partial [Polyangia bacterium]
MRSFFLVFVAVAVAGGCSSGTGLKQGAEAGASGDVVGLPDQAAGSPDAPTGREVTAAKGDDAGPDAPVQAGPEVQADTASPRDLAVPGAEPGQDRSSDAARAPDAERDGAATDVARAGDGGAAGTGGVGSTGGVLGSGGSVGTGGQAGTGGAGGVDGAAGTTGSAAHASVLQHHNNATRDGFYVDSALSRAAVGRLRMDPAFPAATTSGPTYAQPLYLAGTGSNPDLVIVATEQNHVYAFDASSGGKPAWDQPLGMPLPRSSLAVLSSFCGNIDPLGVTGTPIIDPATDTLYVDAMTIASAGATAQHKVFALDARTGTIKKGWPVD